MADMECLNNESHLESDLSNEAQITSEMDKIIEVVKKYDGATTDDVILEVDNENNIIFAELTPEIKESLQNGGGKIDKILVNDVEQTITNKTVNISVPTKLSELSNDKGLIDNTVNNLVNYYTKSETYNKSEILSLIGNIPQFSIQIVDSLPIENISNYTIYLLSATTASGNNYYDEYLYINDQWEIIGNTQIGGGSIANAVTTDTDQTITGTKTFKNLILDSERNAYTKSIGISTDKLKDIQSYMSCTVFGAEVDFYRHDSTIFGARARAQYQSTAIGSGANGQSDYVVALGYGATASGYRSSALGASATATARNSVQLGQGTNSTEGTLQFMGFTLLDAEGKIPNERLSGGASSDTYSKAEIDAMFQTNIGNIDATLNNLNTGEGV